MNYGCSTIQRRNNMMRKIWFGLIVFALLIAVLVIWFTKDGKQQITIGAIMPLTGDVASYGIANKNGIDLAAEKVNREGGINGKPIIVLYEDDSADPKAGVAAARKLISINHVKVIIGAVPSSVTLAIADVVEKARVVLISPASSSPKITNAGDYVFRNYPSDELEGNLVAKFAIDHNLMTAAVITNNNDYGTGLNKVFSTAYRNANGNIVLNEGYLEGTTDFRSILAKIGQSSPQCIFVVGYSKELGTLIKQARELGITSQFLSTVNFYDAQSITTGGNAVEGVIFSSPVFDSKSSDPIVQEFVIAFKNRFVKEPDVWSAHGYDALLLVVQAMRNKGITADNIKEGLYGIKDFPGVSGKTTFDINGDVVKDARFLTVKNGEFISYK
jgi:branched-chain amino acid transport system substrate-binding protein